MIDQTQLRALAERVVSTNNDGDPTTLLDDVYAVDCVSVEGLGMEGGPDRATSGIDGIRGKWAWWESNNEIHAAKATGPYLHGDDKFSVIFEMDTTFKPTGERIQMQEVAVYTVSDGKIVREEFFY